MGLMGSRRVLLSAQATLPAPTLDYNYVSTMALGGTETFTRASTGWYFNSSGVLTSAATDAARFDYDPTTARTNKLTRSAEFDHVDWTKDACAATANAVTDPLGTTLAETLTEDSSGSSRGVRQTVTAASNVAYSFSVHAKAGTRSWLRLMINTGSDDLLAWFNLGTGVVGSTAVSGAATGVTSSISDAGGGWYRCTVSGTPTVVDAGSFGCFVRMATADSQTTYAGNGSGTLHIWGAQLETGSSATAYLATAGSAVTSCTPRGLLIEEARTNLFLNSAVGVTQSCTVAAAANTLSFWGTGTITLTGTSTSGPLVGTGAATRVTLTFTPTAGSLTLTVSGSCTNVQLELGSFASSPIVTVGSTVTRAADVCTITTLTPWFNVNAGTLLIDHSLLFRKTTGVQVAAMIDDGTNNNRIGIFATDSIGLHASAITAGAASQMSSSIGTPVAGTRYVVALAYATNDCAVYKSSTQTAVDTSVTLPVVTQMRIGHRNADYLNGHVRRVAYYNVRAAARFLPQITA